MNHEFKKLSRICTCARPAVTLPDGGIKDPGPHTEACVVTIATKLMRNSGFFVTPNDQKKIDRFVEECGETYAGAIGGGYTFEFTPTGLGVIFVVKNTIKNKKINLTDFDSW
jgi:hypothetical protein